MQMRPIRSIRNRLLISILASQILILGITAYASYAVIQRESEEIFGARLATSARVFEALVARQVDHATVTKPFVIALPRELENATTNDETPLGHPYETKIAFQVWRDDGTLLARSTSAPAQRFSPHVEGFSMQAVAGELWRVFVLRSGSNWIQVAEKNEVRAELLHDLGIAVMTPLVGGTVILLIVANLLVHYGLIPLRELAAKIADRKPESLGALDMGDVPDEVVPVVHAINDLLTRIRLVFARERRFTDAAAHELRTPLAALKIHADNMARATMDSERAQSSEKLREGLDRTIKLTDQMLVYSRTQGTQDHEQRVPIHLADCVAETVTALEPLRRRKGQRVKIACDPDTAETQIVGEPTKIERLVRNLLDNASRYAPDGSEIDIRLSSEGDFVVLRIANQGPIIPPDLRNRAFEPYYRVPGSGSDGSGLGLAIVKEIADQHHAEITLSIPDDAEGTVVTVRFPTS